MMPPRQGAPVAAALRLGVRETDWVALPVLDRVGEREREGETEVTGEREAVPKGVALSREELEGAAEAVPSRLPAVLREGEELEEAERQVVGESEGPTETLAVGPALRDAQLPEADCDCEAVPQADWEGESEPVEVGLPLAVGERETQALEDLLAVAQALALADALCS